LNEKANILVVDDDILTLNAVRKILEAENHNVETVQSGEEALALFSKKTFELVIADLVLTGMDGMELLKQIKALKSLTSVVFLTGYTDISTSLEKLKIDADDFIIKPYDICEFNFRIRKSLEKYYLRKKFKIKSHMHRDMNALEIFAGAIAHDFNNMLTSILGYSDLIINEISQEDKHYIQIKEINSSAKRFKELTSQISRFSRKNDKDLEIVQIENVIKEVLETLQLSSSVNIVTDIQPNSPGILAHETNIIQLLLNLCTYLISAMDSNGTLHISLSNFLLKEENFENKITFKEFVKLSVSNNGKGMSKQMQERILDPFYITNPNGDETEIHLTLVKTILRKYKGKLSLETELGKGSTFNVLFPPCKISDSVK